MLTKRKIIFGAYDTAVNGLWTLTEWSLSEATPKTTMVDIPGRLDGPIDFTEALTGDVEYNTRTLKVKLESSEGTRLERRARIEQMFNQLHGRRCKIWLPDDADHYLSGRLTIKEEYNDPAHAAVTVTATCEPWRYENEETVIKLERQDRYAEAVLVNNGRRPIYPVITVGLQLLIKLSDADPTSGGPAYKFSAGAYTIPEFNLGAGEEYRFYYVVIDAEGKESYITYRKAVL